jgi:hypothetical protein
MSFMFLVTTSIVRPSSSVGLNSTTSVHQVPGLARERYEDVIAPFSQAAGIEELPRPYPAHTFICR